MLFSRIVVLRTPVILLIARNNVIDKTATGIDAETVNPTLSTKYIDEAPKMIPNKAPITMGNQVSSGMLWSSEINGL